MKKKIFIISAIVLVIILLVLRFTIFSNRGLSTITLDINPSIEIKINKKDEVKSIKALNEDAKDIIDFKFGNKKLDEVVELIVDNVVEKGYTKDNEVTVLIHSKGTIDNNKVKDTVNKKFEDKQVVPNVIVVENISKEDEEFAKKHNITPAKAAYINEIKKENEEVSTEDLIEKDIKELDTIKETGDYCDPGYRLDNKECLKEISRESATRGDVCPGGYFDYNGICYEEVGIEEKEEYICEEGFELENDKCVRTETIESEVQYQCDKGELTRKGDVNPLGASDNDKYYCVDKSTGKAPTLRCLTNPGHIMINGKCYNGPAPLINGGCPGADKPINGGCYSLDDEDQWICPNGAIYEKSKGTLVELCPDTFTYLEPKIVGYKCREEFTLENNKCIRKETHDAGHERYCKDGYTLIEDRCINKNKTIEKKDGYICSNPASRLEGNVCVLYEIINAKHN